LIRAQNDTNRGINVVQQTQKKMRLNDKERKDKLDISNDRSKSEGRRGEAEVEMRSRVHGFGRGMD
jgi:hypothetical protein